MVPFCKIFFVVVFFYQAIFISCKTKSQSVNKNIATHRVEPDSALFHFKHYFNDTLPTPKKYVSDYENLFIPQQEDSLNHLINLFEKQSTNQIAIVSFDTAMVTKQNFDELTLRLANAWGVGDKHKNNGILIGICAGYKKIRIQNGKGIEKILSDSATKNIIDRSFIPYFKEADYFSGTLNGVKAIIQKLNQ
jgi:uncharacterized protein